MRFTEGLFTVDCTSVKEEFDEWLVLFDGDNGAVRGLRLRRDDARVGSVSNLGELAGCGWRGDERLNKTKTIVFRLLSLVNYTKWEIYLVLEGRPRFPLMVDVDAGDEDGGGGGGSHAEHCHEPSGIASRPTQ